MSGGSKGERGSSSLFSAITFRRQWKVRLYFVLGSVFLLEEIFIASRFHRIITHYDSPSNSVKILPRQQLRYEAKSSTRGHQKKSINRPPDAHFNGFPAFYHDLSLNKSYHSKPYSSVRCVGENYQGGDFSWMHRSCHFRFLCFNVSSREFEVYARPDDQGLRSVASHRYPLFDVSASVLASPFDQNHSEIGNGVSLASGTVRHPKDKNDNPYGDSSSRRLQIKGAYKWFPVVVQSSPPEQYYALEEDMILVPFHSLLEEEGRSSKEYSVVWDDLMPIYTLLNMFQLEALDDEKEALLIRYITDETENRANDNRKHLERKMEAFRPLMIRDGRDENENSHNTDKNRHETTRWTTQADATLTPMANSAIGSQLVCAKDGVAGLGPHGIRKPEGKRSANLLPKEGKGALLWKFRNYCISNLGLMRSFSKKVVPPETNAIENSTSYVRVIFSAEAYSRPIFGDDNGYSNSVQRRNITSESTPLEKGLRNFLLSGEMMRSDSHNELHPDFLGNENNHIVVPTDSCRVHIEMHDISKYTANLTNVVELMIDTTVFVATCNEATATAAIFLPRSASLIVLFETNENGENQTGDPISPNCADYRSLLNHLSHVRVHWLPMNRLHSDGDLILLSDLVRRGTKLIEK